MNRRLKYATFCSGIECMSVACRGLPLDPVFFSEIEPFPCAVLKAHYPTIPNLGDMSKIRRDENGNITNGTTTIPFPDGGIDILAAGCPCQDFSVAGKRAGGAEGSGTRSSLIFEFIRIIGEIRPRWFIYENVVGMLSTNKGRDFAHILLAFRDCGYSVAYRTLDAQYVRVDGMERAVPQRRRRVWVVGCLGADESVPAQILFEPDCVAGHTAPRRRTGEGFAYSLAGRDRVDAGVVGEPAADRDGGCLNPLDVQSKRIYQPSGCAPCLPSGGTEGMTIQPSVCIALDGDKLKPREDQRKGGNNPLVVMRNTPFVKTSHAKGKNGDGEKWEQCELAGTRNAIEGGDGRNQECIVSTNSNGEDVAATVNTAMAKLGGDNQTTFGGGGTS